MTGVTTATSIDGSSTVAFGFRDGQAVIADQNPVRGQGGFINIGFPLSRLFGVDPKSRAAGFSAYLHYGFDQASPRDVRRISAANRTKSDAFFGSIQYKLNAIVTFAYEQTYLRTRAVNNAGTLPLFRGIPSRSTHSNRSEFQTIFTF